jgi:hypothetical protein
MKPANDDDEHMMFHAPAHGLKCDLLRGTWQGWANTLLVDVDIHRDQHPDSRVHVVMDPPYGPRTHAGQRTGSSTDATTIAYAPLGLGEVAEAARHVALLRPATVVVFGDDVTSAWWKDTLKAEGFYVFRPGVFWVKPDAAPRMTGDGPTASVEHITVARARDKDAARLGSLPGHYVCPSASVRAEVNNIAGEKPLPLMETLLRDYTRMGDLVVDLYAGRGTTLEAARRLRRHSIGTERDADTWALARKRLSRAYQMDLMELAEMNAANPRKEAGHA